MTAAGWRIVLLASLGGTLEFYDFVIFGIFARDIADAIFPSSSLLVSLMASFAAFAAGYLVRPLGGIVLSHYGDRYGRRRVFLWPVFVMSGATLGMGLVPTHAQWGGAASALMVGSYQGSPSETRCTQASGGCPFRPSSLGGTARAHTRMESARQTILMHAAHSQRGPVADRGLLDPDAPRSGRVDVTLREGRTVTHFTRHPPGTKENPLDTNGVNEKARGLIEPVLGPDRTNGIIRAVNQMDTLGNIRDLVRLLTAQVPDRPYR